MDQKRSTGTPYRDMKPQQKAMFILKIALCIISFGFIFPNIMSD